MAFTVDINQAFQQVFGYGIPDNPLAGKLRAIQTVVRRDYAIPAKGTNAKQDDTNGFVIAQKETEPTSTDSGAPLYDTDLYGREFFLPVYLSRADANGVTRSTTDKNDANVYQLPFPVISIRGNKSIVETSLVERKGKVHEIINQDDFTISIKGIMVTDNNTFPEAMVKKLREWYELNEAFTIVSGLTDQFLQQDDKVIIKSFDMMGIPGSKGVRAYTLELVSDSIFTLELA